MAIMIELLNSQGKRISVHKCEQSVIRIGRGYGNDVILLDPHSCAEHAVIARDESGQWSLRDLDSVNGTLNQQGQKLDVAMLSGDGQIFTLGKQRLRICFSDAMVAPTRLLASGWQSTRILSSLGLLLVCLALIILDLVYDTWMGALGESLATWHHQLLVIPFVLLGFLVWPALLALWSRFRSHESHFRQQATLCYSIVTLWILWDKSVYWLGFNFSHSLLVQLLSHAVPAVLLLTLFWYGFKLAGMQRRSVQLLLTLGLSSTYWAIPIIDGGGPSLQPKYNAEVLPQSWHITPTRSVPAFMSATETLYQRSSVPDHAD